MSNDTDPSLKAAYALDGPEANRALYKSWAETYETDFAEASGYRLPALVAQAFLQAGGHGPALDVGCGTGLVSDHLPPDLVLDGLDISPEMLAQAAGKGRYRDLVEADLSQPLTLKPQSYAGLLSAGTFTHGHVGPEALPPLVALLAPGGIAALIANAAFYQAAGFQPVIEGLVASGEISAPRLTKERIYQADAAAPEDHKDDTAWIIVFEKR